MTENTIDQQNLVADQGGFSAIPGVRKSPRLAPMDDKGLRGNIDAKDNVKTTPKRYKKDDTVTYSYDPYIVVEGKYDSGSKSWSYQIKDTSGNVHAKWVAETDLKRRR